MAQIAVKAAQIAKNPLKPNVVAIDIQPLQSIHGAHIIVGDFRTEVVRKEIDSIVHGRSVDVILSDMAPKFSGNMYSDSQHQLRLCYNALNMAHLYLKRDGNFVTKVLQCGDLDEYRRRLKKEFVTVETFKPAASRSESAEIYLVAKSFRPE